MAGLFVRMMGFDVQNPGMPSHCHHLYLGCVFVLIYIILALTVLPLAPIRLFSAFNILFLALSGSILTLTGLLMASIGLFLAFNILFLALSGIILALTGLPLASIGLYSACNV